MLPMLWLCETEGEDELQALPCKIPAVCNVRHDCESCLGHRESLNLVSSVSEGCADSSLSCPVHLLATVELSPQGQVQILFGFASVLHLWRLKIKAQIKEISAQ